MSDLTEHNIFTSAQAEEHNLAIRPLSNSLTGYKKDIMHATGLHNFSATKGIKYHNTRKHYGFLTANISLNKGFVWKIFL